MPKMGDSRFDAIEKEIIFDDQETVLRSNHKSWGYRECNDLSLCPPAHFSDIPISEIQVRQRIIWKIQSDNNRLKIRLLEDGRSS